MIVLPCTLPLAFVIVPLSMGKGAAKGFGIAIAFGLGVAITLSMYGVIAAIVGEVFIGTFAAPLETVKNWLYFIAGLFAFGFALGELGLVRFRMPSYTGAAPAFIQKQQDYLKALLLGLFLGNIGVGCPHPATPVILTRIAASGDVFYGWMLFFVHAIGRILPLLLLAALAILGVNALSWLVARKEKVERATGWGMVFVAGFILVLGLFSHDWWVYSGQHTLLEELTQEERFLGIIVSRFNLAEPPHTHEIPTGRGLFDLPLWLGNWVLVGLWVLPMWWYYVKKSKGKNQKSKMATGTAEEGDEERIEARVRPYRFWLFATLTALLALTFVWVLPDRFLNHTARFEEAHEEGEMATGEPHGALYHEESEVRQGLAVNFNITPAPVIAGTPARLDFFVNEKPANVQVSVYQLDIEHGKPMHVIGVRDDLNEFFHIHPQPASTPGFFMVDYVFGQPGLYKIWSEIRKDGVNHAFGHPEIEVQGMGLRSDKQISFGRNVIVGDYQVSLELDEPLAKNQEAHLSFDIHTLTGQEVAVESYLGEKMHLVVIKDDLKQFTHAHPESGSGDMHGVGPVNEARAHGPEEAPGVAGPAEEDETIEFHITFTEAGLYKAFAQFRPAGTALAEDEALSASFWIRVEEKAPSAIPDKVWYTIISLILIVFLSWGVKRYIEGARRT